MRAFLVALALALVTAPGLCAPQSFSKLLAAAEKQEKEGSFASAFDSYREAVAMNPKSPRAHRGLGRCMSMYVKFTGKYGGNGPTMKQALSELQTAIRLSPHYAEAYADVGEAMDTQAFMHIREQDTHKQLLAVAVSYYREALKYSPKNHLALYGLGTDLRWLGDKPGALAVLKKYVALAGGSRAEANDVNDAQHSIIMLSRPAEDPNRSFADKVADLERRSHEGHTKGNLGMLKGQAAIYYGKHEGVYPKKLGDLVVEGYIPRMPAVELGDRPATTAVADYGASVCKSNGRINGSKIRGTGRWGYVNDPKASCYGAVFVDSTGTDADGVPWYTW